MLRSQLELIKVLEIEDVKFKPEKGQKKNEKEEIEPVKEEDIEEKKEEEVEEKELTEEAEKKIIDPLADEEEDYEKKKSVPKINDEINIIDKMILDDEDEEEDEP